MKRVYIVMLLISVSVFMISLACTKNSEDKLATAAGNKCDTSNIKYSTDITSILKTYCYDCHSATNNGSSGGIVLEGYPFLKFWIDNGYFAGTITHTSGYVPMPYGRDMLSECNINKILAWINKGYPDN